MRTLFPGTGSRRSGGGGTKAAGTQWRSMRRRGRFRVFVAAPQLREKSSAPQETEAAAPQASAQRAHRRHRERFAQVGFGVRVPGVAAEQLRAGQLGSERLRTVPYFVLVFFFIY